MIICSISPLKYSSGVMSTHVSPIIVVPSGHWQTAVGLQIIVEGQSESVMQSLHISAIQSPAPSDTH